MNTYGLLIGGTEVPSISGRTFESFAPATGRPVARFAMAGADDVDRAVVAARGALHHWSNTSAAERGDALRRVAGAISSNVAELTEVEAVDCGKVLSQARADIDTAVRYFSYFAGVCAAAHGEQIPIGSDVLNVVIREPHGVCAQINAWNFPLNMAARSLAPALAAGNTVVIKTPELAPTTTAILSRLITSAGLPAGSVNVLHGDGATTGSVLSGHPGIDHMTFTGSVASGRLVAARAAENGVPCVLELGGKSPTIVFPDADVAEAARQLARGFVEANGQSCDLPSLAIIHQDVHEEFLGYLLSEVKLMTIGNPIEDPDVGPLISDRQKARVDAYVATATSEGAEVVFGGANLSLSSEGHRYVSPTVIVNVTPEMTVAREEIFGPVLSVMQFDSEQQAIELANRSDYGLAAFVWSADIGRCLRLTREIRAGQVYVNCFSSGDSVVTPFGGFKDSGYGREKGFEALRTYSRTKNICISGRSHG